MPWRPFAVTVLYVDFTLLCAACCAVILGEAMATTPSPDFMALFDQHTHNLQAPAGSALINLPMEHLLHPSNFHPLEGRRYSAGIHPQFQGDWALALQGLRHFVAQPFVHALGECGLDRRGPLPLPEQCRFFTTQLELAQQHGLPVIIHCVGAWHLLPLLCRPYPLVPKIIHGFRKQWPLAQQLLDQGFTLSFGPHFNAEVLRRCPPHRRAIETDDSGLSLVEVAQRQSLALGF